MPPGLRMGRMEAARLSAREGAGRGEVLASLRSRSFYAHSLTDVIRDKLHRCG